MNPLHPINQPLLTSTFLTLLLACLAVLPGLAAAQPGWDSNRGNCEEVLANPQNFDIADVRRCAQIWESYRSVQNLSPEETQRVARGFSRLFYEGTPTDRSMAETALARMNARVLERGDFLTQSGSSTRSDQPMIRVGESNRNARRNAETRNTAGHRLYTRGRYREAIREFEAALDADPWYARAKYNLACNLALAGEVQDALRHLDELSRWDSTEAQTQITNARTDEDFISLRDNPRFRRITGYARIQLLNGAESQGRRATEGLRDTLQENRYDVASLGFDRYQRSRPLIFYRVGFDSQADDIKRIIANAATGVRIMDWESEYDIVVVYGQSDSRGGSAVPAPIIQGRLAGTEVDTGLEATVEETQESIDSAQDFVDEWVPSF